MAKSLDNGFGLSDEEINKRLAKVVIAQMDRELEYRATLKQAGSVGVVVPKRDQLRGSSLSNPNGYSGMDPEAREFIINHFSAGRRYCILNGSEKSMEMDVAKTIEFLRGRSYEEILDFAHEGIKRSKSFAVRDALAITRLCELCIQYCVWLKGHYPANYSKEDKQVA